MDHPLSPQSDDYMDMEKGEISKMSIMPTTYQRPHPPIWQVIDIPRSIKWAAEHQVNGIFWMATVKELKKHFELYRETLFEAKGVQVDLGEGLALVRIVM